MAKRSGSTLDNQPKVKLGIDPKTEVTYNKVTNLLASRVIREVNGIRYEWKPGETLSVRSEDTEFLRNLTLGGRPCCGSLPHLIFEVSED